MFRRLLRSLPQTEEHRPGPVGTGDCARNFRERLIAPTPIDDIVIKHSHPMPDPSPFADQYGSGIYLGLRDAGWTEVPRLIADSVKDPLRGWLEAPQRLLLQTVRDGSNQQRGAEAVWRI